MATKVTLVLFSVLALSSCKSSKLVPENTYLLQKNRVIGANESVAETDLLDQVRHKPNRKLIIFKAHMWANYFGKQVGLNKIG